MSKPKSPFMTTLRIFRKPAEKVDTHPYRKFSLLAVVGDRVIEVGIWRTRFDSSKALRDARIAAIKQCWSLMPSCAVEIAD